MAAVGSRVKVGTTLFTVNEQPVVAMYGTLPAYRDMQSGDSGTDVTQLQQSLSDLGYNPGTTDGTYGSATVTAVEAWQQAAGLTVDGIVHLGQVVFVTGPSRVIAQVGTVGDAVSSGGQTPLYDSIVLTSCLLARRSDVHTRKILILFSDGVDTISVNSLNDAIDSALQGDVAIYTVDVSDAPHVYPGTLVMRGLAANTGGRYFPLESGASKVLDAILEDFHSTFTVAYKLPTHAAGFHLVRILPTHDPTLQFHCRRGYYYPEN